MCSPILKMAFSELHTHDMICCAPPYVNGTVQPLLMKPKCYRSQIVLYACHDVRKVENTRYIMLVFIIFSLFFYCRLQELCDCLLYSDAPRGEKWPKVSEFFSFAFLKSSLKRSCLATFLKFSQLHRGSEWTLPGNNLSASMPSS